jgi:segregation and condensation protein B
MQDPIVPSTHQQAHKNAGTEAPVVEKPAAQGLVDTNTANVSAENKALLVEYVDDEAANYKKVTDDDRVDKYTVDKDTVTSKSTMPVVQLQKIIESALMAYSQPLTVEKLQTLFTGDHLLESGFETVVPEKNEILTALAAISSSCHNHGFELKKVSSGWRFQVRAEMAPWINKLWEEKPQRYSRALLETLSIIAYRQPITRGDIEEIRGVAVSSHIVKTLSEREWIKVVGQRDVPGRPSLFATTKHFLDYFNLENLEGLPSLRELADIDSLTPELNLETSKASTVAGSTETSDSDNLERDFALSNKLETQLDDNKNLKLQNETPADTNLDISVADTIEESNLDDNVK